MELNEQTLEQILIRQREEYQKHADAMERRFEGRLEEVSRETRLHMGVLIEDVKGDIKLLAEGFDGLRQQLIALRDMVAENTEDLELIKVDIEIMKSELAIIRRDLKEKAGRDELAVLEARVAKLERTARSSH